MGLCQNSQFQSPSVHAELISWERNPQGIFSFKDNQEYYLKKSLVLTKDLVLFYDDLKKDIYFNNFDSVTEFTKQFQRLQIKIGQRESLLKSSSLKKFPISQNSFWFFKKQKDIDNLNVNKIALKENGFYRLGRQVIRVKKIHRKQFSTKEPEQSFQSYDGEGPQCRICLKSESLEQPFARNICSCSEQNPVHFSCLYNWVNRNTDSNNKEIRRGIFGELKCELCQDIYPNKVRVGNEKKSLQEMEYDEKQDFIHLEIFNAQNQKKVVQYIIVPKKKKYIIGRNTKADIQIVENSVSRSHALLTYENDQWFIQDNDSKFGTFELLSKEIVLRSQENIFISFDNILLKIHSNKHCQCTNSRSLLNPQSKSNLFQGKQISEDDSWNYFSHKEISISQNFHSDSIYQANAQEVVMGQQSTKLKDEYNLSTGREHFIKKRIEFLNTHQDQSQRESDLNFSVNSTEYLF